MVFIYLRKLWRDYPDLFLLSVFVQRTKNTDTYTSFLFNNSLINVQNAADTYIILFPNACSIWNEYIQQEN